MAESIVTTALPLPKRKRYAGGIVHEWSTRLKRMAWGFDATIGNHRYRICKFNSREQAETELAIMKAKADCERHGLSVDETIDASVTLWEKFETLLEMKIGAIGATAELLVAADLLRRGFDVYRSVASNADSDLIAVKHREMRRIEVKSAIKRDGRTRYKRHRFNPLNHDVLALCFIRDCRIEYRPPVEEWFDADLKPN